MKQSDNAIEVEALRKSFGKVSVLKGVDFAVKRGSILALLGPNGAGKTTTVRILSTLLTPDSGRAMILGYDVVKQAEQVRGVIGLTGQYAAVDEYLTGQENMEMMGRLYRLSSADTKQRSRDLLKEFDLVDAANRAVKTYSGGMRRRLDIAVSLISSAPVLFLDEPTTGLDPRSRLTMWEIIKQLSATDITILLTTQHMEEADKLADQIVVIDGGKVIANGTPGDLKARVGSEHVDITIEQSSDFRAAVKALEGIELQADEKRLLISIATKEGAGHVKRILDRLDNAHARVESMSLHRPTLDDAFLSLTGHAATQEDAPEDGTQKKGKKDKKQ